jgi:serine/threonine protein phosphatase PrpC
MDKIFNHSVKTDVGLVRKANEDAAGFAPSEEVCNNGDLFIVCDGMGGHVGGAIASNSAVQSIIDHFKSGLHDNPYIAINDAIVFANEQIFARAQAEPELKGMGTTCTVLLIRGSETFIGHVGDSRIYIQSKDKLHRITKDHSFVQTLVDQGLISDADAESHPRKNELIKALGIREFVEPEVCSKAIEAAAGDTFMMCSDGLCGLVADRNMESVISSSDTIDNKADKLISMAKGAGGHDNITVALIDILSSPFSATVFVDLSPKEDISITGEISPLTDTQEIGGLASGSSAEIPIWKKPIFLGVASVLVIVVFILILVWPGGEQEEPIVSATDSKQQDVISATAINELQDCESGYYKVIIDDKAFSSMSQATDTLRERANDSYFTDCLLYKPVSGAIVKGNGVRKIDNIYPGDEVSLDCQCLNDKKATVPVSAGVVEPAELIENTDINALEINKDTVFSNVVSDTSANQDNQDTLKTE